MNATTQVSGAPSTTQAVKDTVSTIRTAAQVKLQYLRTLASKIVADSKIPAAAFFAKVKAIYAAVKGFVVNAAKSVWNWLPYTVRGAALPALTSTKKGYNALAGFVKDSLGFVARQFGKGIDFVNKAIHTVGYYASKPFCWVLPPVGNFLIRRNQAFTDFRQSVINYARVAFAGTGAILTEAYTNDTTVKVTTGFSSVLLPVILVNALTSGAVLAAISSIPVVGAIAAAALGGKGIVIALGLSATIGAIISLFRSDNRAIFAKKASETIVSAMYLGEGLDQMDSALDLDEDNLPVEAYLPGAIVLSKDYAQRANDYANLANAIREGSAPAVTMESIGVPAMIETLVGNMEATTETAVSEAEKALGIKLIKHAPRNQSSKKNKR